MRAERLQAGAAELAHEDEALLRSCCPCVSLDTAVSENPKKPSRARRSWRRRMWRCWRSCCTCAEPPPRSAPAWRRSRACSRRAVLVGSRLRCKAPQSRYACTSHLGGQDKGLPTLCSPALPGVTGIMLGRCHCRAPVVQCICVWPSCTCARQLSSHSSMLVTPLEKL